MSAKVPIHPSTHAGDRTRLKDPTMKLGYSVLHSASRHFVPAMVIATGAASFGQASPAANGPAISRIDLYAGYSYFHPFSSDIHNYQYPVTPAGGVVGATGYFNRYLGVQAEASFSPNAYNDNDCIYTAQAGPVLRYQKRRFVPFFHALGGVAQQGGPMDQPCNVWGWGITGGLGVDYILPLFHDHFAIRPAQVDFTYSHIDNGPLVYPAGYSGGLGEIYTIRYSASLVYRFGDIHGGLRSMTHVVAHAAPSAVTQPVTQTGHAPAFLCTATPAGVYPGDPVTLTATLVNAKAPKNSKYLWASTAAQISGTDATQTIDTTNLPTGTYTASAQLYDGVKNRQVATCTTQFSVDYWHTRTGKLPRNP